jgi:hypothetical protein
MEARNTVREVMIVLEASFMLLLKMTEAIPLSAFAGFPYPVEHHDRIGQEYPAMVRRQL